MKFIDTHCHLNFKAFENGAPKIIRRALDVDVVRFVVPGTDIATSQKARVLANENNEVYAVVGVHPHHIHNYHAETFEEALQTDIEILAEMLLDPKVLGVGEVGLDKHTYYASRHGDGMEITEDVFALQKKLFLSQVELAVNVGKSLVIHNREAKSDLVKIVSENVSLFQKMSKKTVLHCCEPDNDLLDLAKKHRFFIGVDGDVTFDPSKQDFIKEVPRELLVLETDSPYILPEPLRSQKRYPNTPASIPLIAQSVARIWGCSVFDVASTTTSNAKELFGLVESC